MNCIACNALMAQKKEWLFECPSCRFYSSTLKSGAGRGVDGLETLRRNNFKIIIDRLKTHRALKGLKCLEVGAAEGWFLDAIAKECVELNAIEPSKQALDLQNRGYKTTQGFFPDCLPPEEKYDLIVFNDVFEHLPDPVTAIKSCEAHLSDNGILVLNLPNGEGFFYRVANMLDKLGFEKPFNRLWQKDFPSPHMSYFSAGNMGNFVRAHSGLRKTDRFYLPSITTTGLQNRIESSFSGITKHIVYAGLLLLVPAQQILPKDIMVFFLEKTSSSARR